jgi:hypothetical protein
MKKGILLISAVFLASAAWADCTYRGQSYSEGAEVCGAGGSLQRCDQGQWTLTVRKCEGQSSKTHSSKKSHVHPKKKRTPSPAY